MRPKPPLVKSPRGLRKKVARPKMLLNLSLMEKPKRPKEGLRKKSLGKKPRQKKLARLMKMRTSMIQLKR